MNNVGVNAFYRGTGENPYRGDIGKGVDYDRFEATTPFIESGANHALLSTIYRAGAHRLVKHLDTVPKNRIADIGCGTGIATLELLLNHHGIEALGIEISDGMRYVAEYKFGKNDGAELPATVDAATRAYWENFRDLAATFSNVSFQQGDMRKLPLADSALDGAVANQVIHWMNDDADIGKAFGEVHRVLRPGASFVWNTASHFYNHARFPSAEYAFTNNDVFKYFVDELRTRSKKDLVHAPNVVRHNFDTLSAIAAKQGFSTLNVGTFLHDFDLRTLLTNHIPRIGYALLDTKGVSPEEAQRLVNESLAALVTNPQALADTKRRYAIVPILKSTKQ